MPQVPAGCFRALRLPSGLLFRDELLLAELSNLSKRWKNHDEPGPFQHLEPNLNHQVLKSTDVETRAPLLKVQMEACSQSGSSYIDTASQYAQHRFLTSIASILCVKRIIESAPTENVSKESADREPIKDKKCANKLNTKPPPCLAGRGANTELMVPSGSTWGDNHGPRTCWS